METPKKPVMALALKKLPVSLKEVGFMLDVQLKVSIPIG